MAGVEDPEGGALPLPLAEKAAPPAPSHQDVREAAASAAALLNPAILFVTLPGEANVFDQMLLADQTRSLAAGDLLVLTCSLEELGAGAEMAARTRVRERRRRAAQKGVPFMRPDASDDDLFPPSRCFFSSAGDLIVDGRVIAAILYRAGYDPSHYPSARAWRGRRAAELCSAVNIPSAAGQLAGAKTVQQALSGMTPEQLVSRFALSPTEAALCAQVATPMFPLPTHRSAPELEPVDTNPDGFVLKPQREGGGHNTYGAEIPAKLDQLYAERTQDAHVLMERILPPISETCIVRDGRILGPMPVISELGIYSAAIYAVEEGGVTSDLADGHTVFQQSVVHVGRSPYLLRTKDASSGEGGVVAGAGSIDVIAE
jgi:hypothetical protein